MHFADPMVFKSFIGYDARRGLHLTIVNGLIRRELIDDVNSSQLGEAQ